MKKMYHVGICGWSINFETIKTMQGLSKKDFNVTSIKDITNRSTRFMDSLVLANPTFDNDQQTAFLEYVEDGGTAIIIILSELIEPDQSKMLLSQFGLRILTTHKAKNLPIQYTENYPNEKLRGKKTHIPSNEKVHYTFFTLQKNAENKAVFPLIVSKNLFTTHIITAKAIYGQGAVIIMNSRSLSKDRADLLNHLLDIGGPIRENQLSTIQNELKAYLPGMIEETFEAFEEIPLPVIHRKVQQQDLNIDEIDLLLLIEDLIKEGKIYAKIRGGTLIRY